MVIVMTGIIRVRACFAAGGPNLDNLESIAPIRFTKPTSCALKNQQLVGRRRSVVRRGHQRSYRRFDGSFFTCKA